MWLGKLKISTRHKIRANWRYFSLEQAREQNANVNLWSKPDSEMGRGLWALRAGEAARRQGEDAFEQFHINLLRARHEQRLDLDSLDVLKSIASESFLDQEVFRHDIYDRSTLDRVRKDHIEAVEEFGIFGVPTFRFPNGATAFLKTLVPASDEDLDTLIQILTVMEHHPYIGEIKRPQPPWPKGSQD